jgi:hypothetical protein
MHSTFIFIGVFLINIALLSAEGNCIDEHFNQIHFTHEHFKGEKFHPKKSTLKKTSSFSFKSELENSGQFWMDKGQSILEDLLGRKENTNHAKNVSC